MTIDPAPTRITDRPEMHSRLPPPPDPVHSDGWLVFIVVCIGVIIAGSAWAIWESVR